MKYYKLSKTDLEISRIGLGTWVFGGHHWGGSKEQECMTVLKIALEQGVNFVDTAPIYGFGRAEEIIGKAMKSRRDKIVLATKCGLIWKGKQIKHDLSKSSIREEVENSLRRLKTDYIDLYQCHWPDPNTPIAQTMDILNKLKEEQKIRYIGVCNFSLELLKEATVLAEIVSFQGQYSLLERDLKQEIIPYCLEHQIGVLAYGVLGGGILSGKYQEPPVWAKSDVRHFFYKYYEGEGFDRSKQILDVMRQIIPIPLNKCTLKKHIYSQKRRDKYINTKSLISGFGINHPLYQTALNWVRQQEGVVVTLVGCRNKQQVLDNVDAMDWELSEEDLRCL